MAFFNRTKPAGLAEQLGANPGTIPQTAPPVLVMRAAESDARRPCWVHGKKAFFHRWASSARPILPRGVEPDENAQHYQLSLTHAIVEYEDGSVERVWPQDVKFADGGGFEEYAWLPMTEGDADGDNQS